MTNSEGELASPSQRHFYLLGMEGNGASSHVSLVDRVRLVKNMMSVLSFLLLFSVCRLPFINSTSSSPLVPCCQPSTMVLTCSLLTATRSKSRNLPLTNIASKPYDSGPASIILAGF